MTALPHSIPIEAVQSVINHQAYGFNHSLMASKQKPSVKAKSKTTVKSKSKSPSRKNKKKQQPPTKFGRWLKKYLLLSCLGFGFIFLSYLGYLDYTVRHEFEGKRWSVPAKVYARPLELYPGLVLNLNDFEAMLKRMNYHEHAQVSMPGSYIQDGTHSITLHTRPFKFWDKQQDDLTVQIVFAEQTINRVVNLEEAKEEAIIRLDPVPIGSFYPGRKEDRILLKLEQAPDLLIQGLLVTEDKDFYQHFGIAPLSILRAMWANLKAGAIVQGGSTITQQLVKNMYLSSERKLWRKINEALMALIMDYRFSKDEILEAYLNEVYLGQDRARSIHGFGLASQFYFGRDLENLQPDQIATLVALVKGPSWYDPRRSPERLIERRNLVLAKLHEQGYITKRQMLKGQEQDTNVVPRQHHAVNRYPAFLDLVRRELHKQYQDDDLTSEGLRIFTTLDIAIQDILEERITRKLNYLEKRPKVSNLETATIVTRRDNGEIVALAGSRNPNDSGYNRAVDAMRPVGSLIKPAVYLTALDYPDKYTVTTKVSDTNIKVKAQKGQFWRPSNYDKKQHGEVELHTALAKSYNLATVHIGMDIGIARTAKTLRNMGLDRPVDLYPSLLLGATPMTPLEITQLYQTLSSDGFITPLRAIHAVTSAEGQPLSRYPLKIKQTLDPGPTYLTNTLLQEVMRNGTGQSAYEYLPASLNLAGKTGTTNSYRDSWFAGFSGDYLSVVWIGRDDNKPTALSGSSGALQLWISLMRKIAHKPVLLSPPDDIEAVLIDSQSGLRANQFCPDAVSYPYIKGSEPKEYAPCATIIGIDPKVPESVNEIKNWFQSIFN